MHNRHLVIATIAATTACVATTPRWAAAQRSAPITGLASISASAGIGPAPGGTSWSAGARYVPFLTEHLQLGGGLSYGGSNGRFAQQALGMSGTARYLFGANPRSAPFVEADLSESVAQREIGRLTATAAAGWLQFLTASTALDARFTATRYSTGSQTTTQIRVDPAVFVRRIHETSQGELQAPGSFDYGGDVAVSLSPNVIYSATAGYSPFFNRVLQVGIGGGLTILPAHGAAPVTAATYTSNALLRAFYPSDWGLRPFVGVFGTEQWTRSTYRTELGTHGASVGARYYISPELAMDIQIEHRIYDPGSSPFPYFGRHMETVFNLGLTLHQPQ